MMKVNLKVSPWRRLGGAFLFLLFIPVLHASSYFNVKNYGAKGDGKTIDSPAINSAIEAAAKEGGGTVWFPAGKYASYSVRLQSNITLWLDAGATLIAASPTENQGFDVAEPNETDMYQDFGHSHWKNSLIWGINLENVTICGQGMIDGAGLTRETDRTKGVGNKAIALKLCRNVTLKDIRMFRCGHFALLATGVDNLIVDNLLIDTNRDGLDIDCCRNVRIANCGVNSPYDDAIVLKASYGLGFFRNTENNTITNCFVSGYDMGSMLDGTFRRDIPQSSNQDYPCERIKLGTESSGGFKNITISNCIFERCRGLGLETVDGGDLEDVTISNLVLRDVNASPIFMRLGARMRSPKGTPVGHLRRISIDNVRVYNADSMYVCLIAGIPGHPIEDVKLSNIYLYQQGGGTKAHATLTIPEKESSYPEQTMFGPLPAAVFYIRHANNVQINNAEAQFLNPDERPSVCLDDVNDVAFNHVIFKQPKAPAAFSLTRVTGFRTFNCRGIKDTVIEKTEKQTY
jgi:polygalacturonase